MKLALIALVSLVACDACRPAGPALLVTHEPGRSAEVQAQDVALVETTCPSADPDRPNPTHQLGTAAVIGPHRLLTAHHVVRCTLGLGLYVDPLAVTVNFGRSTDVDLPARVLIIHDASDIAVLGVQDSLTPTTAPVIGLQPAVGDWVCAVAAVPSWSRRCGVVQPRALGAVVFRYSAHVEHGNSGGPVYDAEGRLVGVVSMRYECDDGSSCDTEAYPVFGLSIDVGK